MSEYGKNKGRDVTGIIRGLTEDRHQLISDLVKHRQGDLTVVLENVHDVHNVHAILRTCDAVGIHEIYVINTYTPKQVKGGKKSSASAKKWVGMKMFFEVSDCIAHLKEKGFQIFTTHLTEDSKSLYELDLTQPVALCFGNERSGVSHELIALSDGNFRIPMFGMIESLNVSVATSVSIYEACRQRMSKGMYDSCGLSETQYHAIFSELSWK